MRCELYGRNFYALTHKYGLGRGYKRCGWGEANGDSWGRGGAQVELRRREDRRAGHGVSTPPPYWGNGLERELCPSGKIFRFLISKRRVLVHSVEQSLLLEQTVH